MAVNRDGSNLERSKYLRLLEIQHDLRRRVVTRVPPGIMLLQCRTCNEIKTINHYRKAERGYYGLDQHCTPCRNARMPRYDVALVGHHTCTKCHHTKPMHAFTIDTRRPDGRSNRCRQCVRIEKERRALRKVAKPSVEQVRRQQTLDLAIKFKLLEVPDFDIKQCRCCGRICGVWHYYSQPQNADGLESRCDDCTRGYVAQVTLNDHNILNKAR